jgi:hypothetical protein
MTRLLARILDATVPIKKVENQLRRVTRELQSTLRFMLGFWNIYFEMQPICNFNVTN